MNLNEMIKNGDLVPVTTELLDGVAVRIKSFSQDEVMVGNEGDCHQNDLRTRCRKCEGYIQHIRDLDTEVKKLRDIKLVRFNKDDCWLWQGDGFDYPESLVCPVVMSADTLRDLLSKIPETKSDPNTEDSELRPCPCCGSREVEVEESGAGCRVVCYTCGIGHVEGNWTRKYAIDTWNKRR